MKFCEKCGNVLVVEKKKKPILVCRKCHKKYKIAHDKVMITEEIHEPKKQIVIMEKDEGVAEFPKTKILCPQCENGEAYWWMQQTRAADEPPTLFYRCTKCSYSWRIYG